MPRCSVVWRSSTRSHLVLVLAVAMMGCGQVTSEREAPSIVAHGGMAGDVAQGGATHCGNGGETLQPGGAPGAAGVLGLSGASGGAGVPLSAGAAGAATGFCGNGVMDPGEECEYGSDGSGPACLPSCRCGSPAECVPQCGDGILQTWEACDDGNLLSNDGCTACCEMLSPNVIWRLDQCQYGRAAGASPWLRLPSYCGDGTLQTHILDEECDDGNFTDGDGCSATCRVEPEPPPLCGDGHVDPGEECDDGENDGGYEECHVGCLLGARCGDGIVQEEAGEECDRGSDNNTGGFEGCTPDCRYGPRCGDGIIQIDLGEQCDGTSGCSISCYFEPSR